MKKIFVLDTNVLLTDPRAIYAFEENNVILPLAVVEEIDDQKKKSTDIGYNARQTSRLLDELRKKGKINRGIQFENGGSIKIVVDEKELVLPPGLSANKMDNRIVSTALRQKEENPNNQVVLVSNDINLRLIANAFDLDAEEYKADKLHKEAIFTGFIELKLESRFLDQFYQDQELKLDNIGDNEDEVEIFPNTMVQMTAIDKNKTTALGKYDGDKIIPLIFDKSFPSSIKPRNREQKYAIELLLDDNIKLVTLSGKAGTGKTLLAIAAGLAGVVEKNIYDRLLVTRPVIPMGKDLGFLPGSKEEKLQPWMQPIHDNLDFIIKQNNSQKFTFDQLIEKNLLQIEALTYIRGRSVPDQYIIVDEAQNLSKHEVKTIITRAGKGTKIVFTGDPYQIDNPYLDLQTNGLTYLAYKFREYNIAGHIMLKKGERSELAEIASEIL